MLKTIFLSIFPKTSFSILGFLPCEKRITKGFAGLEVTGGTVPPMVPMVLPA